MKYIIEKLMVVALCIIVAVGCNREETPYVDNGKDDPTEEGVGYLWFASMNVEVESSGEVVSTKADNYEAADNYTVSIYSQELQEFVYTSTYGEIKALEELITLDVGEYDIHVNSPANEDLCGWEQPTYGSVESIEISSRETTEVDEIICTLSNIKVSLTLSADLLSLFQADNGTDEDLNVSVSLGESTLDFGREESRYGYFEAIEESNELTILLSGMYNVAAADEDPEYIAIEGWKQVISGVKAGEWRKISIRVENANDGSVTFGITVETWVYDDVIDVNVMSGSYVYEEETIVDPSDETTDLNSAVITLANGHNIEDPFTVDASIFDFDAETCYDVIKAYVTPYGDATVESIDATFTSDSSSFMSALESAGFAEGALSLWPTNPISTYLTIKEDSGVVTVTAKYSAMAAIYKYAGTHTAKIKVVDSEGRRSFTTLTIVVDSSGGGSTDQDSDVSIVWDGGYSFDDRHVISTTSYPDVVINITSPTGFTGFVVGIDSATLTASSLEEMGLAAEMDLINPATTDMATKLDDLGFPVEGDVEGATSMVVDITQFMPALAILGAGNTDFVLSVSDASGTTTRTIKVEAQ